LINVGSFPVGTTTIITKALGITTLSLRPMLPKITTVNYSCSKVSCIVYCIFSIKNIIIFCCKTSHLNEVSTVLSPPLQFVFPALVLDETGCLRQVSLICTSSYGLLKKNLILTSNSSVTKL